MTGTVASVIIDRGFAFIRLDDGSGDVFLHCHDLDDSIPFDATLEERRLMFDIETTDKGKRARNARGS